MLPLQMGVPGGPELLVVLSVAVLFLVVPVGLVVLLVTRSDGGDGGGGDGGLEARVDRLKRRVERLEDEKR